MIRHFLFCPCDEANHDFLFYPCDVMTHHFLFCPCDEANHDFLFYPCGKIHLCPCGKIHYLCPCGKIHLLCLCLLFLKDYHFEDFQQKDLENFFFLSCGFSLSFSFDFSAPLVQSADLVTNLLYSFGLLDSLGGIHVKRS